jgi:hypothetical protein
VIEVSRNIPDAPGIDLKPDPMAAATGAELVAMMRQLRLWAGQPTLRQISARAEKRLAISTLSVTLRSANLPPFELVVTFAQACGCAEDEVCRWATAWRSIALREESARTSWTAGGGPPRAQYGTSNSCGLPFSRGWIE